MKTQTITIAIMSAMVSICHAGWIYDNYNDGVKIGGHLLNVVVDPYYNTYGNLNNLRVDFTPAVSFGECAGLVKIPALFDGKPLVQISGVSFLVDAAKCAGFIIPETVTDVSTFAFICDTWWHVQSYTGAPLNDLTFPTYVMPTLPLYFTGDKPKLSSSFNTVCRSERQWAGRTLEIYDQCEMNVTGASGGFSAGCFVVEGTSGWVTNDYFNGGLVQYYAAKVDVSPAERRFVDSCEISLSCVNDTATIFYTLDGSEPVTNETSNCFKYKNPITVTESTAIKALAYVPAYSSFMENQQLRVTYGKSYAKTAAVPVVLYPFDSTFYQSNEKVVLSCSTPNAVIRYTTDGSVVTSNSAVYDSPLSISETTTIRARAYCYGIEESDELDETFVRDWHTVDVPVIVPESGSFGNVSQDVSISCVTDGATILYTTDGSDPAVNGREYKHPFDIYQSCTVRAIAVKYDWKNSVESTVTFTRSESLSEAANLYGYTMETDSAAPWTVDAVVSHDGVSSVRSGAIGNNGTTYLMASVKKAGTVSFWWKAQCEEPDEEDGEDGYYDYGAFLVDDVVKARIAGHDTGWQFVSVDVASGGKHTLRWEYSKDGATSYAPDCVWVDQVQWSPADGSGYTLTSPEPVPYSWLRQYNLGVASGDFEAAANAASGKTQGGAATSVWEEFVAGTDPTNAQSVFTAKIEMQDGVPVVKWEPDLNTNGVVRSYKVYGRETLDKDGEWQYPTNSLHKFFKVMVEMP